MIEKNKQIAIDWIEKKLQGQGDPLEDLDKEVVFIIPGTDTNPIFGKFVGIEEVKTFFKLLQEKLLQKKISHTFKVTDCIAEGNRAVVLLEEIFTLENKPFEPSRNRVAWIFELNSEQKIVYLDCYDNTLVNSEILA